MSDARHRPFFLVLAARKSFEALVGPVPKELAARFRFVKPRHTARVEALLPESRLVISKSYTRPESNCSVFAARRAGVPTLLLVDGPLEWANLYSNPSLSRLGGEATGLYEPIVHDAVATIGHAQQRWIAARNADRGVAFVNYANRRIQTDRVGLPTSSTPDFDFLLTTAKTAAFGADEHRTLESMLRACCAALEAAGHQTLVRTFDARLDASLRSSVSPALIRLDTRGSSREALSRARCVIGTSSSVLLEAMHHEKPTAVLDFRGTPLFYRGGWQLDRRTAWAACFSSMLEAPPSRMKAQRESLRANLSDRDFFSVCHRVDRGEFLLSPRPFDTRDLAVEVGIRKHEAPSRGILRISQTLAGTAKLQ
jgi:hypothetical protein